MPRAIARTRGADQAIASPGMQFERAPVRSQRLRRPAAGSVGASVTGCLGVGSSSSAAACIYSSASSFLVLDMGKPREDDQPQDQNLAREQLFSRASRGLLELGQALGIAEPAQVRGAETPREPGHGFRPGEAVPLESIVRSWLELRCLRQARRPRPINGSSWSTANDDRWISGREFGPTAHAPSSLSGARGLRIGLCLLPTAREDIAAGRLLRLLEARSLQSLGWCGVPAEPAPAGLAARVLRPPGRPLRAWP